MELKLNRFKGAVPYRNIEYLGRCYDFIKLNPLDLSERPQDGGGCMPVFAVEITPALCDVSVPDCRYLIPRGSRYLAESRALKASRAKVWHSAQHFSDSFKGTISGVRGVDDALYFTASGKLTQIANEMSVSRSVLTFVQSYFEDCAIQLKEDFGEHLGLDPRLKQAVLDLVSEDRCEAFIRRFGTHYAHEVIFGGRMYQCIKLSNEQYREYMFESLDLAASAESTFKKAKALLNGESQGSTVRELVASEEITVDDLKWVGGTPDTDFDTWVQSVRDDPKPMQLDLRPLSSLFTKKHFDTLDDSVIQERKRWMEGAVERHIHASATVVSLTERLAGKKYHLRYQGYEDSEDAYSGKWLGGADDYAGFKRLVPGKNAQKLSWILETVRGKFDEFYLRSAASPQKTRSTWLGYEDQYLVDGYPSPVPWVLIPVPERKDEYFIRPKLGPDWEDDASGLGVGLWLDDKIGVGSFDEMPQYGASWKLEPVD